MQGVNQLAIILNSDHDAPEVLSVTIWALGQIGKHSAEHSRAIAITNVLSNILAVS